MRTKTTTVRFAPDCVSLQHTTNVLYVLLPWKRVYTIKDLSPRTLPRDILAKVELISGISSSVCSLYYLHGFEMKTDSVITFGIDVNNGTMIGMSIEEEYRQLFDVCRTRPGDVCRYVVTSQCGSHVIDVLLFYACHCGWADVCEALISTDVIHTTTPFGRTLLHAAATGDNPSTLNLLLQNGCHPLTVDQYGTMASDIAAKMSSDTCVRILKAAEREWKITHAQETLTTTTTRVITDDLCDVMTVTMTIPEVRTIAATRQSDDVTELKPDQDTSHTSPESDNQQPPQSLPNTNNNCSLLHERTKSEQRPKTTIGLVRSDIDNNQPVGNSLKSSESRYLRHPTPPDVSSLFVTSVKYNISECKYPPSNKDNSVSNEESKLNEEKKKKELSKKKTTTRNQSVVEYYNQHPEIMPRPTTVPISRLVQREIDRAKKLALIDKVKVERMEQVFQEWLAGKRRKQARQENIESYSESESDDEASRVEAAYDEWLASKRLDRTSAKKDDKRRPHQLTPCAKPNYLHVGSPYKRDVIEPHPDTYLLSFHSWAAQRKLIRDTKAYNARNANAGRFILPSSKQEFLAMNAKYNSNTRKDISDEKNNDVGVTAVMSQNNKNMFNSSVKVHNCEVVNSIGDSNDSHTRCGTRNAPRNGFRNFRRGQGDSRDVDAENRKRNVSFADAIVGSCTGQPMAQKPKSALHTSHTFRNNQAKPRVVTFSDDMPVLRSNGIISKVMDNCGIGYEEWMDSKVKGHTK